MRSLAPIRMPVLILIFALGLLWQMPGLAARPAPACQAEAVVVAAAGDPYLATQQPAAKAERGRVLEKWRARRAALEEWLVSGSSEPKTAKERNGD